MPVVINDFEAVLDAPRPPNANQAPAEGQSPSAAGVEPKDVAPVLRVLEVRALRAWAH